VLALLFAGALYFLSVAGGIPLFASLGGEKSAFAQALEAYDGEIRENPDLSPRRRNGLLDSLEKSALDMENFLSVLKRRRIALRGADPGEAGAYMDAYIRGVERVREQYPYSGPIAALAAEALILSAAGKSPSEEEAEDIRDLTALMNQGSLQDLALAFAVYSRAMADPALARFLPRELFTLLCSLTQGEEREKYLVNACIRTLLEGETQEAAAMVNDLLGTREFSGAPAALLESTYRFGGEFFYDHGNFLRAAELFSLFSDARSLGRQGDALWLAGFTDSARGLWRVAAAEKSAAGQNSGALQKSIPPGGETGGNPDSASVRARVLYNMASTASSAGEERGWLELLFAANAEYQPGRIFGILRYSRLLPLARALTILEQAGQTEGLFDLETLRRRSEDWTIDRTVAETWLLLNRHPGDGRLFEWAAWYFDFQRRYEETALALRNAGINQVEGSWAALHRAFALVRESRLDEAEKTLRGVVRLPREKAASSGGAEPEAPGGQNSPGAAAGDRRDQPLWQISANLGLLLDLRRNPQEALRYYEIAAGILAAGDRLFAQVPPPAVSAVNDPVPEAVPEGAAPPAAGPPPVSAVSAAPGIPAAGVSPERRDAARIQLRIARCFRAMGREPDSRRVLEYALDLDPENLQARLELRRLNAPGGQKVFS
jgi:tetratricopeptide (TPR) repeat protein